MPLTDDELSQKVAELREQHRYITNAIDELTRTIDFATGEVRRKLTDLIHITRQLEALESEAQARYMND